MKTSLRSFLFVFLLSCTIALSASNASATPNKKAVLILFPYQSDLPNHDISLHALREEFDDADDLELDVYYEYLELIRFPDPAYQQQLFDLLTVKYSDKQIDLIILQSDILLNLWLEQRTMILPDTPVVFYSTNTASIETLELPRDVTGVSGTVDFTQSIKWVLREFPSVNEIVLVYGTGEAEREWIQPVDILQKETGEQAQIIDLSGLPLDEITHQVEALPPSSIVLYELMFEDAASVRYRPIDVLLELTAVSLVPVISGYDQFIGTGTIGGYMYTTEQQARNAAQIGLRILRGEAVENIPVEKDQSSRFIFDHLALQRFDIPLSDLPPDSIIKNQQYSFWELYQPEIIITSVIIAVLLFLIIFLLGVTRQLNVTRLALAVRTQELEKAYDDLLVLDRLRSEFIDTISHELRTPVTNINLYFDLLIKGKPENHARYIDILKKESSRLSNLLEGIFDFSNLQENLEKANLIAINLNELVAVEVASIESQAQARDLELSFSPAPAVIKILGDPVQLQYAVGHLLQNAVSYTLSGYVKITVRQADKRKSMCLTVADSGMGMDEKDVAHCFERFYRGKRVGQYNLTPGAGLGLAKVKDIVTFHKGFIEVESKIDQGSTFSVFLPVA